MLPWVRVRVRVRVGLGLRLDLGNLDGIVVALLLYVLVMIC